MRKLKKVRLAAIVLIAVAGLAACTNWEQRTYQTLAASKAVIDTAANEYNAGQLPQTEEVNALIVKARQSQTAAVDAFKEYLYLKAATGTGAAVLTTQQQAVDTAVAQVTTIITDIKALKGAK